MYFPALYRTLEQDSHILDDPAQGWHQQIEQSTHPLTHDTTGEGYQSRQNRKGVPVTTKRERGTSHDKTGERYQ